MLFKLTGTRSACGCHMQCCVINVLSKVRSVCRHLAAMKQRELENAKLTAEEMEAQLAPLR